MMRAYARLCAVALAPLWIASATSCGGGDAGLTCGPGAVVKDGICVSALVEPVCGAGTSLDPASNECRPDVRCSAGTVYDAAARACVSASSCGPGTHLDVATANCVPDAVCGPGTTYDPDLRLCLPSYTCADGTHGDADAGACVPDDRCGAGTTYHPVTHLCVPDVTCGPGLVAHDDVCLSATDVVALEADVAEGLLDDNDPAFGGAPIPLPLAAIGSSTVFTGTIGRPVDLDGDDEVDQDVDAWGFDGVAGTLLRVRVLDDGLGAPAFRVVGPNGYVRTSALGVVHEPVREVLLPWDGAYRIEVAPVGALRAEGAPTGSPDEGYVGVVEELPWPALRALDAVPLPDVASDAGNLFSLLDNFFVVRAPAETPILAVATGAPGATRPALLVFDQDARFSGEIELDEVPEGWTALAPAWGAAENGVVIVVDWTTSDGFDASFSLGASIAPRHDLGAVPAGSTVEHEAVLVPGQYAAGYGFTAEEGELVTIHLPGAASPRFVVVPPTGPALRGDVLDRSALSFFTRTAGAWRVVVVNRSTSDVLVLPAVMSETPIASGALSGPGDASITASGDALRATRRLAERAIVLVDATAPLLLAATVDFDLGMPDLDVHRVDESGFLIDRRRAGEDDLATVRALVDAPGLAIVILDPGTIVPPNPAVRGWSLDVAAAAIPPLGDVEPTEVAAEASPLDAPSVAGAATLVRGFVADDEVDVYAFEADPPLAAGELLEIHVENLTSASALPFEVQDAANVVVREANSARASGDALFAADGAGPFTLHVEGTVDEGVAYVVSLARRAAVVESEPNDDLPGADAYAIGPAGRLQVYGTTKGGARDVAIVSPTSSLPPGAALRVRAENLYEADDLHLSLLDASGLVVAASEHEDAVLLATVGGTSPVRIAVEGDGASRVDTYRLVVDVVGPVEVEPNDDAFTATPLVVPVAGAATVWGQAARFATDWYAVDAAGAPVFVRWANALERGDFRVAILDDNGVERLAVEDYAGELAVDGVGAAFFVSITSTSFSSDDRPDLYELAVERITDAAEVEPNDVAGAPRTLPAVVYGQSRADDVDRFAFTAPAAGLGTLVLASARVRLAPLTLRVLTTAGAVVVAADGADPVLELDPGTLAPGALYTIEVVSTVAGTGEVGAYVVSVESF